MAKIYNLVGMQHDEMYDIIKKAPLGTVFYISKRQTRFLQLRVDGLDKKLVIEYAQAKRDNEDVPPGDAFFDPETKVIILADGIHRAEADILIGVEGGTPADDVPFPVRIHLGSAQDALLFASGGNSKHGKRRSRRDIENAVRSLLLDPELGRWSNGRLAKAANVSVPYIEKMRERLEKEGVAPRIAPEDRVGERGGKPYRRRTKGTDAPPKSIETDDASVNPADTDTVATTSPSTDANADNATTHLAVTVPPLAKPAPKADELDANAQSLPQDSGATITETARQFAEALKAALDNVPPALREPTRLELLNTLKADSLVASTNSETNNI